MQIYEINAFTWLNALSLYYGRPITLHNIPDHELKPLADMHLDAIWLMGVWEHSPRGRDVALDHAGLREDYQRVLVDFKSEDVVGSPYCVRRYVVDSRLGGPGGLAAFRQQLKRLGLKLILDFVPNHIALDHDWVSKHPDYLVQGTAEDLQSDAATFFEAGGAILAHGRDPYFPAWTDTVQVNAFSEAYRRASINILLEIAAQCDGVRCDMAMLLTNRIFAKTWTEERVGKTPETEFWNVVIGELRQRVADFRFLAEVYWDMEYELQQQGFDFCYDKRLYDRMISNDMIGLNHHLTADLAYQNKLIRFIENHDESRALKTLGLERSRMAALIVATLPGATLWHEGQFYGHKIKIPVQLGRRPLEPNDMALHRFYVRLLAESAHSVYRNGTWQLRQTDKAWPENLSHQNMVPYTWREGEARRMVVVNYSDQRSQARIKLPDFGLENGTWKLTDWLDHAEYERIGDRMVEDGLYIDLRPWSAHLFDFVPLG